MKEIFWGDYRLDEKDIAKLANSNNQKELNFLFGKILYNSKNLLKDMQIFNKDKLKEILKNYKIKSSYKKDFALRRLKILRALYLGTDEKIRGLSWKR